MCPAGWRTDGSKHLSWRKSRRAAGRDAHKLEGRLLGRKSKYSTERSSWRISGWVGFLLYKVRVSDKIQLQLQGLAVAQPEVSPTLS